MMQYLEPYWVLVSSATPWPKAWATLVDQWDAPILATAIVGKADYVVSANTHDFPPEDDSRNHTFRGITYIPPEPFITDILHISL